MKDPNKYPPGWDDERVQRLIQHDNSQSDEEAIAEDEAASEIEDQTLMEVPNDLVPVVRELIAKRSKVS